MMERHEVPAVPFTGLRKRSPFFREVEIVSVASRDLREAPPPPSVLANGLTLVGSLPPFSTSCLS